MSAQEEFLRGFWRIRCIVLVLGIILLELVGLPLRAQKGTRPTQGQSAQVIPAPFKTWKSQTTGREYRVKVGNDLLYAEWVNLPPAMAQGGAYIRTECRRVGAKWVGTSRSYLPCTVGEGPKEHIGNWCRLLTRIEIDTIAADRISGRGESLRRFDCKTCKVLETSWADFVWVPKRQKVLGSRQ
jgi:hypothetical protein